MSSNVTGLYVSLFSLLGRYLLGGHSKFFIVKLTSKVGASVDPKLGTHRSKILPSTFSGFHNLSFLGFDMQTFEKSHKCCVTIATFVSILVICSLMTIISKSKCAACGTSLYMIGEVKISLKTILFVDAENCNVELLTSNNFCLP